MGALKVSVVVPIYNVEKYLRECLDSLVNQTLQDMEIICVDDCSTDSSKEIIREYMARDPRVKMIAKDKNSGYGNSMNQGFDMAQGEYIGILESDDYAEPDMYEKLYTMAKKNQLDLVKSSFWLYYSTPVKMNKKYEVASVVTEHETFCPSWDIEVPLEMADFYNLKPSIWSSIYRTQFIRENGIRFLETPGASFQDTSFSFKVMALAQRVQVTSEAFVHYRQDNENSSVNSGSKVFCICEEYAEIQRFLETNPFNRGILELVASRLKYDAYMWNYERLAPKFRYLFIERAAREFEEAFKNGVMDRHYFEAWKWDDVKHMVEDPVGYYTEKALNQPGYSTKELTRIQNSMSYKVGCAITFIPRKVLGGIQSVRDDGIIYTFKLACKKVLGRLLWKEVPRSR